MSFDAANAKQSLPVQGKDIAGQLKPPQYKAFGPSKKRFNFEQPTALVFLLSERRGGGAMVDKLSVCSQARVRHKTSEEQLKCGSVTRIIIII